MKLTRCNCLIVALVLRCIHKGSSIRSTDSHKRIPGYNAFYPHFYIVLSDGNTVIEYLPLSKPLPWYEQLWFKGYIHIGKDEYGT